MSSTSNCSPIVVCATGLTSIEQRDVSDTLAKLSVPFTTDLNHRIVTHLVVHLVGTSKHQLAIQKGLICVSIDWIYASEEKHCIQDATHFPVSIFTGLCISVTQLERSERDRLQLLVEKHGGKFTRTLNNPKLGVNDDSDFATHLLALEGSGEKYEYAIEWKVVVCSPAWIDACIKEKVWQTEKPYLIASVTGAKLRDMSMHPRTNYAGANDLTQRERRLAMEIRGDDSEKEPTRKLIDLLPSSDLLTEVNNGAVFRFDTFFIAGVDQEIRDYCMRLIFVGDGRLHQVLSKHVTKCVIGQDAESSLLDAIKRHPREPIVVTLKWLIEISGLDLPSQYKIAAEAGEKEHEVKKEGRTIGGGDVIVAEVKSENNYSSIKMPEIRIPDSACNPTRKGKRGALSRVKEEELFHPGRSRRKTPKQQPP